MKQITEDYVSYEIAKLLKEKGFNEDVTTFYNSNGKFEYCSFPLNHNLDIGSGFTSAPAQSLALKWLREVHHIFIQIELYSKYDDYWFEVFQNTHRIMVEKREVYNSYEEAVEAACLYVLKNLI